MTPLTPLNIAAKITMLCLTLAVSGTQAAVIYGNDSFEGEALGDFSTTANSTSYVNTADSPGNVDVVGNIASTVGGTANDPSGQHLQIVGNQNKHITQASAMALLTDGVVSLEITFKLYFNNTDTDNDGRILYSALGDFSDTVLIQLFQTSASPDPGNFIYGDSHWYSASVQIDPSDVGGAFTDTAKLRFAEANGGKFNTNFVIDDVVITGIVPAPAALPAGLAMLGIVAMRRRRMS